MEVTVNTNNKEDVKKAIEFLKKFVEDETTGANALGDMFGSEPSPSPEQNEEKKDSDSEIQTY